MLESFRCSREFPSGYSDWLDLEENSPRRREGLRLCRARSVWSTMPVEVRTLSV